MWNLYTIIHQSDEWQELPKNTPPMQVVFPIWEERHGFIFLLSFKDKSVRTFPLDISIEENQDAVDTEKVLMWARFFQLNEDKVFLRREKEKLNA